MIYFFDGLGMPLFLLEEYAKNEQEYLSHASRRRYQFRQEADRRSSQVTEARELSKRLAGGILRGLEQALVFVEGTAKKGTYVVHIPPEIDVRAIRERLGLTQRQFAVRFGFSVNTLRHWEQGRRVPEGPARAYLIVIDREPKAVEKALRIA